MKTYQVTVRAILTKTFTVSAENEEDASIEGQDLFTVACEDGEDYHQFIHELVEVIAPKYRTEDGYIFYVLPDGTVADNLNPALVDMSWDSFEDFWASTEGTAIEVKE